MKNITRFGLATIGVAAVLGATLTSKAETPDTFHQVLGDWVVKLS